MSGALGSSTRALVLSLVLTVSWAVAARAQDQQPPAIAKGTLQTSFAIVPEVRLSRPVTDAENIGDLVWQRNSAELQVAETMVLPCRGWNMFETLDRVPTIPDAADPYRASGGS